MYVCMYVCVCNIIGHVMLLYVVVKEMPGWVSDSKVQRVEWLNSLLQKIWPQLSAGIEVIVKEQVQPQLDANCPKILGKMILERFSLGTISPKIVGINLQTLESDVQVDVELRWAGDMDILLQVGSPVATPIEVSEFRFSATARIELVELCAKVPCFKAMSVTFMKKPLVDFSLKLAALDIMNVGPADYNVTGIVRNLIQSSLSETALYPKKIVVPLSGDADDVDALSAIDPVAVLYITFKGAKNLKRANCFGSDPYVLAKTMRQEVRTQPQYYSVNPEWNETHDIMVYDRETQEIDLSVIDADVANMETLLGSAKLSLSELPPFERVEFKLKLTGPSCPAKAYITLACDYVPLHVAKSKAAKDADKDEEALRDVEDVLYDLSLEQLRNDVLLSDDEEDDLMDQDKESLGAAGVWAWTSPGSSLSHIRSGASLLPSSSAAAAHPSHHRGPSLGVLTVSALQLRGLKVSPGWLGGTPLCYVMLNFESQEKRTKAQPCSEFPVFGEVFYFVSEKPEGQSVEVKLLQGAANSHRVLGQASIALEELLGTENSTLQREFMLEGDTRECFVSLKMHWLHAETQQPQLE
mmetsp:Transcript_11256/g.18431  ORF Transcript_11256/g.18431 Transcript_11256/m.18431 type:complete len:583 (+) Transcript_11256:1-1749(+)